MPICYEQYSFRIVVFNQSLHECCFAATVSALLYECLCIAIHELMNRFSNTCCPSFIGSFFCLRVSEMVYQYRLHRIHFHHEIHLLIYIARVWSCCTYQDYHIFARYLNEPTVYLFPMSMNHLVLHSYFLIFLLFLLNSSHSSNGASMFFKVIPNWIQVL